MTVMHSFFKTSSFVELRNRFIFLVVALFVFRFGTHVPIPGINPIQLQDMFGGQQSGVLGMVNLLSGGALSKFSILALGILPYISASIMMQLMGFVVPALERLKKDGEAGRKKLTQYTRYATVALAATQAAGIAHMLQGTPGLVQSPGVVFGVTTALALTSGALFVMWLGEQVTERGLGNGISLVIFAGIAAGAPGAVTQTWELARTGSLSPFFLMGVGALILSVLYGVVHIEQGLRKVLINYARPPQGSTKVYGTPTSNLPMKLNMSGVMPAVFASTIISVPTMLFSFLKEYESMQWLQDVAVYLAPGQPVYYGLFVAVVVFFCFFYSALSFNTEEVAENLKKSGAFIPGLRPGEVTAQYLKTVLYRLTFWGSAYMAAICVIPDWFVQHYNLPINFGGTTLLIVVVVTMDLKAQIQNYLVSHKYQGVLM